MSVAIFDWPKGLIQTALREGGSATSALAGFRAAGGRIRTQTWYRLWGQTELERARVGDEIGANPRRIPTSGEIQTSTSRRARGYMQRVTVLGRDADGNVLARDVSLRPGALVSRQNAIDKALALLQAGMETPEGRERYPLRALLAAFYVGTYRFEPEEP